MLRHCIMQMQRQSFPLDHVIYVNSINEPGSEYIADNYSGLLEDLLEGTQGSLKIGYGKTLSFHENYTAALSLANINNYDLFLKIDDDDIYRQNYVEDVVRDFVSRKWDYSGAVSAGLLVGHKWEPHCVLAGLGLGEMDRELKVPDLMPSTAAFSRKAIKAILSLEAVDGFEDVHWRRHLARRLEIVMAQREDKNFVYNVHGDNVSTGTWL